MKKKFNHYFTNNEIEHNIIQKKINICGQEFIFNTDNGMFSKSGLDYGTRLLIDNINFNDIKGKVLDVGCGYGPIGIYVARQIEHDVHMIDVNQNAINLCQENARVNGVTNVKIYESDAYKNVNDKFSLIITNPPIRAGKQKIYEILFDAKNCLLDDGKVLFVMRKNHGVKSAIRDLSAEYSVKVIAKDNGFYIVELNKIKK